MFVVGAIKDCLTADSMSHCTGSRVGPGEAKPAHVSLEAARNRSVTDDERLREIDAGAIARAAVALPLNLRRAAISMLSGVRQSEHSILYGISADTSFRHYRNARKALCKLFR
jgi:hypothetical protein